MNEIDPGNFAREDSTDYSLQGDGVDWYTGHDHAGHPLLVALQFPNVIVLMFGGDGRLQDVTIVPGFPTTSQGFFSRDDDEVLERWFQQTGYHPGAITVKKFSLPDYNIKIADFPHFYQEILKHPEAHQEDEVAFSQRELVRWSTEGLFEFWLNESTDLWIDQAGGIQAS
jgi:hypothetical protein